MPDRRKVQWSQLKVGIVGLAGFLILFVLIFLLTGNTGLFQNSAHLRTYMDDASGIPDGAAVRLNGITIGALNKLNLTGSRDPKRIVEFDMQVRARFLPQIPVDSVAGISAINLLGDKFINITKGTAPQHVQPGDEIASVPNQDIPELMAQSASLLAQFQDLLGRVNSILNDVEAGKGNIGKMLKDEELYTRLNAAIADAQQLLSAVRTGKGTISHLLNDDELYQDVRASIGKLNSLVDELQQGHGTAGKLLKDDALYNDLRKTTTQFNELLGDLQAGRGTAGKLLKDEAMYRNINQLLGKVDATIDKLNAGQGTLGQLMVNPQLYDSLNGATGELHQFVKDLRANPKKFLRIKLAIF